MLVPLLALALAHADPIDTGRPDPVLPEHPALAHAARWMGTDYRWGGRGTARNPGMDCLGLLYRGWGPVTGTSWTRYPVNPSPLVKSGLLGEPVQGWAGRKRNSAELQDLEPGDVLYLLIADREIHDDPLFIETRSCHGFEKPDDNGLCSTAYWPWHTALYAGDGWIMHAAPGDEVRMDPLENLAWDALYVTRPAPP